MRTSRALLLSFAAPAGLAFAGTAIHVESSVNGSAYSSSSNAVPGDWVLVQVRVSRSDLQPTIGLAGMLFKIGMSGLHDEPLREWSTPTSAAGTFGPGVDPQTGLGRVAPFAAVLATTMPGTTRSGDTAVITGPGTEGLIQIGQASTVLAGTKYNNSPSPVIFRFGFTAGTLPAGVRTIRITVDNIRDGSARWYTSPTTITGDPSLAPIDSNPGGTVTIVPTPGVLGGLVVAGAWCARRRRRGSNS